MWVTDRRSSGVVTEQAAPRSYNVATPSGEYRRSRCHLNALPDAETPAGFPNTPEPDPDPPEVQHEQESPEVNLPIQDPLNLQPPGAVRTRSGRLSVQCTFYNPS